MKTSRKKLIRQWLINRLQKETGATDCASRSTNYLLCANGMDMETATHRFREDRRANKAANDAKRLIEGVDAVSVQFLRTFAWRRLRFSTLRRFGSRCMCCGAAPKDGAVMNVDHIKSRKEYPHLALDPENVQVLCGDCNHGKGNSAPVDFRPTEKQ